MKVLITGASGQLGTELLKISDHENYGTYNRNAPAIKNGEFMKLDITNRENVLETIKKVKPDVVVHTACEIKVDLCEQKKEWSWGLNVGGTRNVVDACKATDSKVLFISTDHVFDGLKGNYVEDDAVNPANYYGKTKLEGEKIVSECDHFIGRGGVMYSSKMGTFTSWVLRDLKSGEIKAANDLISCPTFATELAECLMHAIKKDLRGLYHTAGGERISKADFIRKFAKTFGFDPGTVKNVSVKELNLPAPRPHDSSLDTSKIKSAGYSFSDVNGALKKLKAQLEA